MNTAKKYLLGLAAALLLIRAAIPDEAPAPIPRSVSTPVAINYATLQLPQAGDMALQILTPTLLEVININTKAPDPASVSNWDFIAADGTAQLPAPAEFKVAVNNIAAPVTAVGFKRRPLYAPLADYDLRIDNRLYLQLANPIPPGQAVTVTNPDATLWPSTVNLSGTFDMRQFSPAIHVDQEGYISTASKKAMVGYYLGSLGEMALPSTTFTLVDTNTGNTVYSGTLTSRPDVGWVYNATPYQQVYRLISALSRFPANTRYWSTAWGVHCLSRLIPRSQWTSPGPMPWASIISAAAWP